MSYSFTVKGATKKELKANAMTELEKAVKNQPEFHRHDIDAAVASFSQYVGAMPDAVEGQSYEMAMFGSVSVTKGVPTEISVGIKVKIEGTPVAKAAAA